MNDGLIDSAEWRYLLAGSVPPQVRLDTRHKMLYSREVSSKDRIRSIARVLNIATAPSLLFLNPILRASTPDYILFNRMTMTFVKIFFKLTDRSDESCSLTKIK